MNSFAIISDVHANGYALKAVLDDVKGKGIDQAYCLGDVVGYNALVHETLQLLKGKNIPTIKGNHDMMATGELAVENCGPNARASMLWTKSELALDELRYLEGLYDHLNPDPTILMVHSKLRDPVGYLRTPACYLEQYKTIRDSFPDVGVCFTGHTHVKKVVVISEGDQVQESNLNRIQINPDLFYFINPGSVGHPRRMDYRASYAVYDGNTRTVHFYRSRYAKRQMAQTNQGHDIHTDLGPGYLRYEIHQAIGRLKRVVRG